MKYGLSTLLLLALIPGCGCGKKEAEPKAKAIRYREPAMYGPATRPRSVYEEQGMYEPATPRTPMPRKGLADIEMDVTADEELEMIPEMEDIEIDEELQMGY